MARLLILTIFLPLAGALAVGLVSTWGRTVVRMVALLTTVLTLLAAAVLLAGYRGAPLAGGEYAVSELAWLGPESGLDVRFSVGLDGLNLWLFGLSALLLVTSVLVSWEAIADRPALFYGMLLLLGCGCLGVFTARDILLFYIFFEFTLIPLYFLIGIWGSEQRRYAAAKFFLFTLAGSVLTFLALLAIVLWDASQSGRGGLTFSIPALTASVTAHPLPRQLQWLVFAGLFAGFAIKVPLFPLHTWLPLAHVQAPTAGSVILAGILLKIGTYGFLRFSIPLLPEAAARGMPWLLWLAVIGILYGALVALAQSDMKRLIAYSSVSHLGFCMVGLFALNRLGTQGSLLQMINHGISTGALFALVGMIYERYHTREISRLSGLARRMPVMAFFLLLFTFSSIGLPGLNGFAGEFLVLLGMFQRGWAEAPAAVSGQLKVIAVLSLLGVVLGAWYMLWLVQRICFGPLREPHDGGPPAASPDLSLREVAALVPLAVFVFWIGLAPRWFLDPVGPALDRMADAMERPLRQVHTPQEKLAQPRIERGPRPGADFGRVSASSRAPRATATAWTSAGKGDRVAGWARPEQDRDDVRLDRDRGRGWLPRALPESGASRRRFPDQVRWSRADQH